MVHAKGRSLIGHVKENRDEPTPLNPWLHADIKGTFGTRNAISFHQDLRTGPPTWPARKSTPANLSKRTLESARAFGNRKARKSEPSDGETSLTVSRLRVAGSIPVSVHGVHGRERAAAPFSRAKGIPADRVPFEIHRCPPRKCVSPRPCERLPSFGLEPITGSQMNQNSTSASDPIGSDRIFQLSLIGRRASWRTLRFRVGPAGV